jgi:hypothetical protein
MSDPVNCDSQDARIAYNHLVNVFGGWIAIVGSLNIGCQDFPYFRQLLEKGYCFPLPTFLALGADQLVALAVMSDADGDFFGKNFKQPGYLNTDLVLQLVVVQYLTVIKVAREEQAPGSLEDFHRFFN